MCNDCNITRRFFLGKRRHTPYFINYCIHEYAKNNIEMQNINL